MASTFFWPDPHCSVLTKIDFGVPVIDLLQWLKIRDTLLGQNYVVQDIPKALRLASSCKHPNAVWLLSCVKGKVVSTKEEARDIFLSHQQDARALCFAWWMLDNCWLDLTLLRRSVELWDSFAAASWSRVFQGFDGAEAFCFAQEAASGYERDGFYQLGCCFESGRGCEVDVELAKEHFFVSALLGASDGAYAYASLLCSSNPDYWLWLGRAASSGNAFRFHRTFSVEVENFFSGSGRASVVFSIGRALKGHIDMEKKRIFGDDSFFESFIRPASQAVSFYESQLKSARMAVDTWTLIATRLKIYKEMRRMISHLIWIARDEANYLVNQSTALISDQKPWICSLQ